MKIIKQILDFLFLLKRKVDEWFLNLDDRVKEEIIDILFPDDIIYDVNGSWSRLDWKIKLEIYKENNP